VPGRPKDPWGDLAEGLWSAVKPLVTQPISDTIYNAVTGIPSALETFAYETMPQAYQDFAKMAGAEADLGLPVSDAPFTRDNFLSALNIAMPEFGALTWPVGTSRIASALADAPDPSLLNAQFGVKPNSMKALYHGSQAAHEILTDGFRSGFNAEMGFPGVSTSQNPNLSYKFAESVPEHTLRAVPRVEAEHVRNMTPWEDVTKLDQWDTMEGFPWERSEAVRLPNTVWAEDETFFPARKSEVGRRLFSPSDVAVEPQPLPGERLSALQSKTIPESEGYPRKAYTDRFMDTRTLGGPTPSDVLFEFGKAVGSAGQYPANAWNKMRYPLQLAAGTNRTIVKLYNALWPKEMERLRELHAGMQSVSEMRPFYTPDVAQALGPKEYNRQQTTYRHAVSAFNNKVSTFASELNASIRTQQQKLGTMLGQVSLNLSTREQDLLAQHLIRLKEAGKTNTDILDYLDELEDAIRQGNVGEFTKTWQTAEPARTQGPNG